MIIPELIYNNQYMRFQKQPKQKNAYPGMLARAERKRNRDWLTNPERGKFNRPQKTGFKAYLRKNPGQ